jgi:hypothetical protein
VEFYSLIDKTGSTLLQKVMSMNVCQIIWVKNRALCSALAKEDLRIQGTLPTDLRDSRPTQQLISLLGEDTVEITPFGELYPHLEANTHSQETCPQG